MIIGIRYDEFNILGEKVLEFYAEEVSDRVPDNTIAVLDTSEITIDEALQLSKNVIELICKKYNTKPRIKSNYITSVGHEILNLYEEEVGEENT